VQRQAEAAGNLADSVQLGPVPDVDQGDGVRVQELVQALQLIKQENDIENIYNKIKYFDKTNHVLIVGLLVTPINVKVIL